MDEKIKYNGDLVGHRLIVLAVKNRQPIPLIASMMKMDEEKVRAVWNDFYYSPAGRVAKE